MLQASYDVAASLLHHRGAFLALIFKLRLGAAAFVGDFLTAALLRLRITLLRHEGVSFTFKLLKML